jgi:hypothetical protein
MEHLLDHKKGSPLFRSKTKLPERRPGAERTKRSGLLRKALCRSHAGGAVQPLIGDLTRPSVQMRFEGRPGLASV